MTPCGKMHRGQPLIPTATLLIGSSVGAPASHASEPADELTVTFDFHRGLQGFVGGFADYPPAHAEIYERTSDHRALPPPLQSQSALFLSGVNRSDDLFMFLKGPISGLRPGASYTVTASLEIATDTPAGCFGVGGAPGESVWVKAGVTAAEPLSALGGSYLRMNIDVGNQSRSGTQAVVLGTMQTPGVASIRASGNSSPLRTVRCRHQSPYLPMDESGC